MLFALGVGNAWGAEETYTYTFSSFTQGSPVEFTNTNPDLTITLKVAPSGQGNTTKPQWNSGSSQARVYAGGTMSIAIGSGTITKIVYNYVINASSGTKPTITGVEGTTSAGTWDGETKTWTGSDTEVLFSTSGTKGNVGFKSFTITYSSSTASDQPVLSSIKISEDLTKKTYEEGEELDLAGLTVTAKYDDNSEEDVTEDVEWSYTPNPLTKGTTSVEVTATYEGKTATQTINGLTVNEHIITPGEYELLLNNVFFGTTAGTVVSSFPTSAKQDDITVTLNGSGNKTRTDAANVRMYTGNTLTFSVPAGYLITSIAFTEPSSSKQWDGKITVNSGDYDETNKSWSGLAQDVVFTFGAQNRIAEAIVTYVADVKSTLTIEKPQNGTISVKNGTTEVTSGTQLSAGTSLVVTPTPATGYVFESLTVGGSAVELTDGTYTFNMPATDVTISATFKENEKPAATLTLSKNGVAETFPGSWKQDDVVTLPSITSDCVKEFVGWSANPTCNVAPEYAAGDSYTLTATAQTLYAVYADGESGEAVAIFSETFDVCNGTGGNDNKWSGTIASSALPDALKNTWTVANAYAANKCAKFGGSSNKRGSAETPSIALTGTATLTFRAAAWSGDSQTLNLLATGATLGEASVTLKNAEWTEYTIAITDAIGSVKIKFEAKNTSSNRFFLDDVVVSQASVTYSDYYTTCTAALDEPVFSVEGGENEAKTITLTATEGTIYYTLDGTTPTASSEKYTTPIVLDECGETTIKAIAISAESKSPVAEATYTIQLPIPTNSEADPYTVAEAIEVYEGGCYNNEEVYVTGTVASASYNSTYDNYNVTLTENGFTFYRLKDESTLVTDNTFNPGDIVVAKGNLSEFDNKCQLAEGCVLVSYTPYTEPKTDISNTEETAYTVDKAFELISDVTNDLTKDVYVKGIVAVASTDLFEEKYLTYSISVDGTTTGNVLKIYDGLDIEGAAFTSKDDVKVGDYVVIKGKLFNYNGTYEINKDNQLVQHISAATITISDITMEVDEVAIITATVDQADAVVTYTIKENAADAISLSGNTITALKEGTATITATVAEGATYLGNSVDFTVTVGPKTESDEVVILAEYNGNWYALKATEGTGNNSLAALEVTYFNGTLYNVEDEDKLLITWERVVVGDKVTFKNGENYLTGGTSTALTLANASFEWTYKVEDGQDTYIYEYEDNGTKARTFLYYNGGYFKNYATSNAKPTQTDYSGYPVVTAPVYATGDVVYTRTVTPGHYGTICIPYESTSYSGAEFYEVSWLQKSGETPVNLYLDQLAANAKLEAGKPYIFRATSTELTVTCTGDAVADPTDGVNGLTGSFAAIPANGVLTGNYVVAQNKFWTATADAYAAANRAYIDASVVPSSEQTKLPGRRRVSLGAAGENAETGIDNIITTDTPVKVIENGQLIIIRYGVKYNVQGQKL